MSNDTLSIDPQVQKYLRKKESNLRSKYFKKYKFVNQELSLILLFQSETMKHIRERYGITNTDFKVLMACRMHRLTHKTTFKPYHLRMYLKGVWMEQIYKSIRSLEKKGYIQRYSHFRRKAYHITPEGENCLRSYAKVFDEVFHGYLQEINSHLNFSVQSLPYNSVQLPT